MSTPNRLETILRTTLHHYRAWRKDLANNNVGADGPNIPDLDEQHRAHWDKNGFLVLPGFFTNAEIDGVTKVVEDSWTASRTMPSPYTVDIFLGPNERRVKLHDAPLEAKSGPYKLNDLYLESDVVRNTVLNQRLVAILANLIGGRPLVCNTLNFEFGSEQAFHTDSLYMTPPKDLNLVATWIALEDCRPDAGPLQYYPGSHKIPPFHFSHGRLTAKQDEMPNYARYMEQEIKSRGLVSERFCAKRGDVFIWHSQLFHGGSPIADRSLTRRSLVTHYFKQGDLVCDERQHNELGYYMVRDHQPVHN